MGGSGSGSWYRSGTKDTTNQYLRLDVRRLASSGRLKSGSPFYWRWSFASGRESSITVHPLPDAIELDYTNRRHDGEPEPIRYRVPLTWTACNYGGRRPWFVCPGRSCGRRVAILYGGRYFLCRRCHDLAYESQNDGGQFSLLHQAQAIHRRLGGSGAIVDPLPPRPKGMHHATYTRLALRYCRLIEAHCGVMRQVMAGIVGDLDRLQS